MSDTFPNTWKLVLSCFYLKRRQEKLTQTNKPTEKRLFKETPAVSIESSPLIYYSAAAEK